MTPSSPLLIQLYDAVVLDMVHEKHAYVRVLAFAPPRPTSPCLPCLSCFSLRQISLLPTFIGPP